MRFLKRISLCILIAGTFYILGRFSAPDAVHAPNQICSEQEPGNGQMVLTASEGKKETTCDTIYHIKSYDMISESLEETTEDIPVRFMGMTRKELEKEIALYEKAPSFHDLELGLVSMELISFQPNEITVFKTYQKKEKQDIYYMKLEDNKIVIYRSDEEEIFMTTEIAFDHLPDDLQQEIIQVKCFDNLEALYDFLESYSS